MNVFKSARAAALVIAVASVMPLAPAFSARADDAVKPDTVIATVGDRKITEKELEDATKPAEVQMRAQLEARVDVLIKEHADETRKQTLDQLTDKALIEAAAKKANQSPDDFLKAELSGKNASTEADAKKFYEAHKNPGSPPFDQIKAQLIPSLGRQTLMDRLKKEYPVKVLLEPKRVAVNSDGHPSLGSPNAPVTIAEFSDFQCPFCKKSEAAVNELRAKYGDKVRLVYLDFPLSFHNHSLDAAKAGRCANEQGKFWQMHDAMFANQAKLDPAGLKAAAKSLGMDSPKFDECLDKAKYEAAIKADMAQGSKLGVDGTPAFFINGRSIIGAQPTAAFVAIVDDELARAASKPQTAVK
jgi:protein-disulfide isomerase